MKIISLARRFYNENKIKKGQTVKLIVGADKGKTGEIIKLFPNDLGH